MATDQPKRKVPAWLLVCIIILAVLLVLFCIAAIVCSSILVARQKRVQVESRVAVARAEIALMESALEHYKLDAGAYPSTEAGLEALRRPPAGVPGEEKWSGPYLEDLPSDPWGNSYQYELRDAENAVVWSCGPDGVSDTEHDIANR
jgi:general secretion pathway protein G